MEREARVTSQPALDVGGLVGADVVEHHMDLVRVVSSIVIGLQAGTVLAVGTPAEVLDSERFRAAVVGADGPRDRQRRAAEKEAAVQR